MAPIFALMLVVIAWIFGTTAGKISDKIVGIKGWAETDVSSQRATNLSVSSE
ncbi:MAG: hypothetical protein ACI4OW_00630 [Alphaproteobacteria bacterium]